MSAVKLDTVEAGLFTPNSRGNAVLDKAFDFLNGHRFGVGGLVVRGTHRCVLAVITHGAHPAVVELHNGVTTVCFDPAGHSLETLKVTVIVCTELTREAYTAVLHRGGTGHGESKSTLCTSR